MKPEPNLVTEAAELAQAMIDELYAREPTHGTFDQVGLLDGLEIVRDYLSHGELGCGLCQALYMIHEAAIDFPRPTMLQLHELAERIGERNHYSKSNQANLTPDQLRSIYNAP